MHNQFKTQKFKHLMLAMGPRDLNSAPYSPVHCSSHSMTSFQSSELTELPVVENSQLFAQRVHSARYAPYTKFCTVCAHCVPFLMTQKLPVGIHVQRDRLYLPLFLAGVFDFEELHMLNRANGMVSPAAGLVAGLAAPLVKGLIQGWAALGASSAASLVGGCSL